MTSNSLAATAFLQPSDDQSGNLTSVRSRSPSVCARSHSVMSAKASLHSGSTSEEVTAPDSNAMSQDSPASESFSVHDCGSPSLPSYTAYGQQSSPPNSRSYSTPTTSSDLLPSPSLSGAASMPNSSNLSYSANTDGCSIPTNITADPSDFGRHYSALNLHPSSLQSDQTLASDQWSRWDGSLEGADKIAESLHWASGQDAVNLDFLQGSNEYKDESSVNSSASLSGVATPAFHSSGRIALSNVGDFLASRY